MYVFAEWLNRLLVTIFGLAAISLIALMTFKVGVIGFLIAMGFLFSTLMVWIAVDCITSYIFYGTVNIFDHRRRPTPPPH